MSRSASSLTYRARTQALAPSAADGLCFVWPADLAQRKRFGASMERTEIQTRIIYHLFPSVCWLLFHPHLCLSCCSSSSCCCCFRQNSNNNNKLCAKRIHFISAIQQNFCDNKFYLCAGNNEASRFVSSLLNVVVVFLSSAL